MSELKPEQILYGAPVHYFPGGIRTAKPKLAFISDLNKDAVASLSVLPMHGGTHEFKSAIRHMEDPYFVTHPNVRTIDGAWDYMPCIVYTTVYKPDWKPVEAPKEEPKPEPVAMAPTSVKTMQDELQELRDRLESQNAKPQPSKKDEKVPVGAGK